MDYDKLEKAKRVAQEVFDEVLCVLAGVEPFGIVWSESPDETKAHIRNLSEIWIAEVLVKEY